MQSTVSPDFDLEVLDNENNVTYNYTEYCIDEGPLEGLIIGTAWFQGLIFAAYTLVFVVALLGNGLVVIAVRASPRMRTVTNLLLVNLAGGDLLLAIACVPFSFVPTLILQHWPFGLAVCKLVSYSQTVSVLVSAYTLLAISVERYAAIMRPLRPRLARRHARWVVCGVWVGALATAAPILIVSQLSQPSDRHKMCEKYLCTESWEPDAGRYYSFALLGLQYALPLSVLVFTYSRIAAEVWGRRTPGEAHNSRDRRMARNKRKDYKSNDELDEMQSLPKTPTLVVFGTNVLRSEDFCLVIDGKATARFKSIATAFPAYFAAHYVVNADYNPHLTEFWEFIQRFIMNINPGDEKIGERGSSKKGDTRKANNTGRVRKTIKGIRDMYLKYKESD